jgi:misacylated tRNA(Ala) deacylase
MALHQLVRCQFEPFLRSLPSVAVKSCTPQTEKKQTFFEVELAETILFPEGGGQPWDTGTVLAELPLPEFTCCMSTPHQSFDFTTSAHTPGLLNDVPVSAVYHTKDGRVAHRTASALEVGASVSVHVDWPRRFDHMQQHSAQHLLSALAFRRFGWFAMQK